MGVSHLETEAEVEGVSYGREFQNEVVDRGNEVVRGRVIDRRSVCSNE